MSEVIEKYYQKCDMCGRVVELANKSKKLDVIGSQWIFGT